MLTAVTEGSSYTTEEVKVNLSGIRRLKVRGTYGHVI